MALSFGVLGAARVAPMALLRPARDLAGVRAQAIAARDRARSQALADHYGVPHVESSYRAVIERDDVDAVYVPLPPGVRGEFVEAALENGKHVLCEKPLATNAADAATLVAMAESRGLVLAEAYHYWYHPFAARIRELVGALGELRAIDAVHRNDAPRDWDVYWKRALGGGSALHLGGYLVHCIRWITGTEPVVVDAAAVWTGDGVDESITGVLTAGSATVSLDVSMCDPNGSDNRLRVLGTKGELVVTNFIVPHYGRRQQVQVAGLELRTPDRTTVEATTDRSTYAYQLEAFVAAVEHGAPMATTGHDIVATATALDSLLAAAGAVAVG